MSSRAGSVVAAREYDSEDGEQNEEEMEASVEQNLKKVANVRKMRPSAFLFKDLLGIDGEDVMHELKEMHKKAKERQAKKKLIVKVANRHFEWKMKKRMAKLERRRVASIEGSYPRRQLVWRLKYNDRMFLEKRTDIALDGGNRK
jgi:hypothetical protein